MRGGNAFAVEGSGALVVAAGVRISGPAIFSRCRKGGVWLKDKFCNGHCHLNITRYRRA